MAENDDISADLDTVQTAVSAVVPVIATLNQTVADLKKQIAAGPPGLTAEQASAIHQRFVNIAKSLTDAIAPAAEVPPPTA